MTGFLTFLAYAKKGARDRDRLPGSADESTLPGAGIITLSLWALATTPVELKRVLKPDRAFKAAAELPAAVSSFVSFSLSWEQSARASLRWSAAALNLSARSVTGSHPGRLVPWIGFPCSAGTGPCGQSLFPKAVVSHAAAVSPSAGSLVSRQQGSSGKLMLSTRLCGSDHSGRPAFRRPSNARSSHARYTGWSE